jgi:hypothetical protein
LEHLLNALQTSSSTKIAGSNVFIRKTGEFHFQFGFNLFSAAGGDCASDPTEQQEQCLTTLAKYSLVGEEEIYFNGGRQTAMICPEDVAGGPLSERLPGSELQRPAGSFPEENLKILDDAPTQWQGNIAGNYLGTQIYSMLFLRLFTGRNNVYFGDTGNNRIL